VAPQSPAMRQPPRSPTIFSGWLKYVAAASSIGQVVSRSIEVEFPARAGRLAGAPHSSGSAVSHGYEPPVCNWGIRSSQQLVSPTNSAGTPGRWRWENTATLNRRCLPRLVRWLGDRRVAITHKEYLRRGQAAILPPTALQLGARIRALLKQTGTTAGR